AVGGFGAQPSDFLRFTSALERLDLNGHPIYRDCLPDSPPGAFGKLLKVGHVHIVGRDDRDLHGAIPGRVADLDDVFENCHSRYQHGRNMRPWSLNPSLWPSPP